MLQVLLFIAEDTDEGATSMYDTSVQCSKAGTQATCIYTHSHTYSTRHM